MSMKVEKGELKKFEREVVNVFADKQGLREPKIGRKARHNQSLDFALKPGSRNQNQNYTYDQAGIPNQTHGSLGVSTNNNDYDQMNMSAKYNKMSPGKHSILPNLRTGSVRTSIQQM